MTNLLKLLGGFLLGLFRSRAAREAEIAFLRQQLLVATRSAPARLRLRAADWLVFAWLYRLFPALLRAAIIFKPETLLRWHRSASACTGAGSRVVVSAGPQSPPRSESWSGQSRRRRPPSPGWQAFLRNQTPQIAAIDRFVVPTIGFKLLYGVRLALRRLVWTNVTVNPTAEWVARQITEAFPWDEAPHYLIRPGRITRGTLDGRRQIVRCRRR